LERDSEGSALTSGVGTIGTSDEIRPSFDPKSRKVTREIPSSDLPQMGSSAREHFLLSSCMRGSGPKTDM